MSEKNMNTAVCQWCGRDYTPGAYWQRYCSNACKQKAKRERKEAEAKKTVATQ